MLRRMFALFLILTVFCGLLPLTAWAEEEATVEDPTVLAGELALTACLPRNCVL